jgi:hypothetical protein
MARERRVKAAFREPWRTEKAECRPFIFYPPGTPEEEKAEIRADPDQDNWLMWADGKPATILAFTKPVKGDAALGRKVADRIVLCVNACVGMKHPGEGIARARDVLMKLLQCGTLEEYQALEVPALSALSRLIPKEDESEGDRPE